MDLTEVVEELVAISRRGPGTDAERRAARRLEARVARAGRYPETETVWVRPHDAAALALHALAAVIASVASVFAPLPGLIALVAVLVSLTLDVVRRFDLLRRLTLRRATQNVIAENPFAERDDARPVRLVVTAGYDTGRGGLLRSDRVARLGARVRARTGGHAPSPRALLVLGVLLCAAAAGARVLTDNDAPWLGPLQLVPTVGLLAGFAALLDLAVSELSPGASDASAAAVAVALVAALDEAPPQRLDVDLVLAGAATGSAAGLRAFVRARRKRWRPEDVAVLHIEPCGRGTPRYWVKDGPFVPLRYHPRLVGLGRRVAEDEPHLGAASVIGRGATGGWAARRSRWPAIAIGCLEGAGYVPGRHQAHDTPDRLDPAAMQAALDLALALVDALDEDLARLDAREPAAA